MAAADFTAAASMAGAFTAEAGAAEAGAAVGEAAVGAAAGVAAAGVTGAPVGAGGAAVGIAAGAGAAVGAGIRAGRSPRRPCPLASRSLRSGPMATVRAAGSGGASGPAPDTILADGLSTFATDRPPAVSSDDIGPD